MQPASKYEADLVRQSIPRDTIENCVRGVLMAKGCPTDIAEAVTAHLIEADDSGVESHGTWRIIQYAGYYDNGYLQADTRPELLKNSQGAWEVDGHGAIGIPAMQLATAHVTAEAKANGLAAVALRNVGHTGRLGAFAEAAAENGCLAIIIGGGGRKNWRLVAPYGGAKALLPTNPYCMGIPGGARGPVILDFATSAAAAGWVYGARIAGTSLPEGVLIDKDGHPTCDPEDYFRGGAILTAGGAKGYALAVVAEMIAEAMLGPTTTECNWLMIALDCSRYRESGALQNAAEEVLSELRDCPPAPGFDRVEVPGERERDQRARNAGKDISLPAATWNEIQGIVERLGLNLESERF
ncbi:Ldh family oxidoreductase [Pelagibius sp. Alg239-R121]|uniref:Ldh family oxidoreductase n=1 Tax=Pelagibius sp. Alg239-R121 TaxID=2993448 RepID=UPI0024A665E8|nr:Ldh family oxidoreductase [Pelagibius sp. Alg239-R121]